MALNDFSLKGNKPVTVADPLEGLTDTEMLSLRHRIDLKLRLDLTKLNLADELGLQYRAGMALLDSVNSGTDGTPANQRAQVFNSVGAMLEKIVKQQKIVYDAERLKRYEAAFLKLLKQMGPEAARTWFDLYSDYITAEQAKEMDLP